MSQWTVTPARHGPFAGRLDPDTVAAYAAATGDRTASVLAGSAVPATFPALLVYPAEKTSRADLPAGIWAHVTGGLHGEHDIVLHRPLVPGEALDTYSEIAAVRTTRAGTRVITRFVQRDATDVVAVEQWWTMMLLGLTGVADLGAPPADHRFPDDARTRPIGSATAHVPAEAAHRYAELSGDRAAHHFDIAAARAAGYDFVFAHGLATMAMCSHRLLALLGVDDPGRVRRVAVRFASPTPLDCDLTVTAFGISENSYAFEAAANGTLTVTHGRLELRT